MTEKNGDDDKQYDRVLVSFTEEAAKRMMAVDRALRERIVGNMLELTAEEHRRLVAQLEEMKARAAPFSSPPRRRSTPPAVATFLLAFIAPKNSAQALLGDLEEMFQKNAERFGENHARRMYWFEVARSFGPLIWQWLKRIGLFTFLIDYFRSKFGL